MPRIVYPGFSGMSGSLEHGMNSPLNPAISQNLLPDRNGILRSVNGYRGVHEVVTVGTFNPASPVAIKSKLLGCFPYDTDKFVMAYYAEGVPGIIFAKAVLASGTSLTYTSINTYSVASAETNNPAGTIAGLESIFVDVGDYIYTSGAAGILRWDKTTGVFESAGLSSPESTALLTELFNGCLFAAYMTGEQKNLLKWSATYDFNNFADGGYEIIGDNEESIVAIISFGSYLVIFKEYTIWVLTGQPNESPALYKVADNISIVRTSSVARSQNYLYFCDRELRLYRFSQGSGIELLADFRSPEFIYFNGSPLSSTATVSRGGEVSLKPESGVSCSIIDNKVYVCYEPYAYQSVYQSVPIVWLYDIFAGTICQRSYFGVNNNFFMRSNIITNFVGIGWGYNHIFFMEKDVSDPSDVFGSYSSGFDPYCSQVYMQKLLTPYLNDQNSVEYRKRFRNVFVSCVGPEASSMAYFVEKSDGTVAKKKYSNFLTNYLPSQTKNIRLNSPTGRRIALLFEDIEMFSSIGVDYDIISKAPYNNAGSTTTGIPDISSR